MPRNDDVEIELENAIEHGGPVEKAAALRVVDIDIGAGRAVVAALSGPAQKDISRMDRFQRWEIDNGVAARVAAAEPECPGFGVTEKDGELIGKHDVGQTDRQTGVVLVVGLANIRQVGANVSMRDDVGDRQHSEISAGMVVVLVRIEHIPDRLIRDRCDGLEDGVMVSIEHVVDENHAFARDIDGNVAAFPREHVEIVAYALDRQYPREALGGKRRRHKPRKCCKNRKIAGSWVHPPRVAYTAPMNKLILPMLLVLGAASARAEHYPEGYADDRAAIVDLQARYVMAMDYFDAEAYAGVFAEDGVLDWARGLVEGRDAIFEFMDSRTYDFTRGAPPAETDDGRNWPSTVRHLITNQVIKVEGDTATALTYWIQFNNNQSRNQVEWMLFGSWYDEFARIDGEWFFTLHRIYNEGNQRTFTAGQENPVRQLDD